MWLMIYILNEDQYLDEILQGLLEIGITRATIIESQGLLHFLADEIPIFVGFRYLFKGNKAFNKMIMSVISDRELLEQAFSMMDEVTGGLHRGGRGVAFTLKIDEYRGPDLDT
ncbi:hypothetical protein JW905_14310 [bacterium]|nr:hypothetical protein [candidate division CSSED10-310 bacterium]